MDASKLTPGVIDGYARRAFKYGACAALAIAMHDKLGWPIVAITDAHNVHDGKAGWGSALHWAVRRPDGKLIDIDGAHDESDLVDAYHGEADEGEAAAGQSSRDIAVEWYVECQGEPIPVSLASTFVTPLLESMREDSSAEPPEQGDASDLAPEQVERPDQADQATHAPD